MRDTTPALEKRLAGIHLGQERDSTWNNPARQRVNFGHSRVARARPFREVVHAREVVGICVSPPAAAPGGWATDGADSGR